MPFTPYHLGPNGFIGLILFRWVNLPAILLINLFMDLEPLVILSLNIHKYPEHGFTHSFAGALVIALIFSLIYSPVKGIVNDCMGLVRLKQKDISYKTVLLGSVLGAWIHVCLDSFLYSDIMPFYPFPDNPFYGRFSPPEVRLFCLACGIAGLLVYFVFLVIKGLSQKPKVRLEK